MLTLLGLAKEDCVIQTLSTKWMRVYPRMEGACPGKSCCKVTQSSCMHYTDQGRARYTCAGEAATSLPENPGTPPACASKSEPKGQRADGSRPFLALPSPVMDAPLPWQRQDTERIGAVYTFQNGQPCRVMGQSDRVTRQARILPRILKGDIP